MTSIKHDQKISILLLKSIFPLIGIWSVYPNSIHQIGYFPYLPLLLCASFFLGIALQINLYQRKHQSKFSAAVCLVFLVLSWLYPSNLFLVLGYSFSWGLLFYYTPLGFIISLPLSYAAYQYPEAYPFLAIPLILFGIAQEPANVAPKTLLNLAIPQLLAGFIFGSLISIFWNFSWVILSPQPDSVLFLYLMISPLVVLKIKYLKTKFFISPALFSLILSVFWLAMGFLGSALILDTFSPFQVIAFFIAIFSLCFLSLPIRADHFLFGGLFLGLASYWFYSSNLPPVFWLSLIGCLGLLFSKTKERIFYGLGLGIILFGFFTQRGPYLDSPQINLFFSKAEPSKTTAFFNRFGWWFSSAPQDMSFNVTKTKDDSFVLENVPFKLRIKEYKNELFFASLLKHLPNNAEQVTILNDVTSYFLAEFHQTQLPLINLNYSNPELLQQQAQTNPTAKKLWLQPNISIHPVHAEALLEKISSQKLIVELIHIPWPSPISSSLNRKHIQKLSQSITPDGSVALIIHLNSIPEYSFLPIAQQIEEEFSAVQYWLPQNNIDSVLILARHSPLSFQTMKKSIQATKKDPYVLLAHAFSTSLPSPTQINIPTPQQYPQVPILHLGALSDSIQKPTDIWSDLTYNDELYLEPLLQQKSHFLSMIQKATQGDMNEVLGKAQQALEESALLSLIEPHLSSAKKEIALALKEGQSSEHWSKAQQFASTAQLISPDAIEPWLLQGEIAIGEGFLELSKEKFQKALTLDKTSLPALNGLARVAGLQEDYGAVEAYLQEALSNHPNNWTTLHNLSVFYQENNNLTAAEKYSQRAIPLSNQHEKPQLALINIHIAQEKWTLALTEVDRLLSQKDSAVAWYLRGRIHFELKIWDKAEEDFRRATLSDPKLHAARGSIGLVRIAQGDKDGALQAFQATLKFDPNNEIARKNIQLLQQERP